jgi:hypothetical protein
MYTSSYTSIPEYVASYKFAPGGDSSDKTRGREGALRGFLISGTMKPNFLFTGTDKKLEGWNSGIGS